MEILYLIIIILLVIFGMTALIPKEKYSTPIKNKKSKNSWDKCGHATTSSGMLNYVELSA